MRRPACLPHDAPASVLPCPHRVATGRQKGERYGVSERRHTRGGAGDGEAGRRAPDEAAPRKRSVHPRGDDTPGRGAPDQPESTAAAFSSDAIVAAEAFAADQPFPLDPFQFDAACHLADGRSVLVAAPTGTGKTVVAEFAIWQARRAGLRAIYTAPLKALSNQKFRDFRQRYGLDEVGLLTGDIVEHPRAPIVVMTTEIYRNMLLEGLRAAQAPPGEEAAELVLPVAARASQDDTPAADDIAELARRAALDEELSSVGCVVFDELHYLSDPGRGPVWEEAIIHSPAHVQLVGLSATVSNAGELRRWIEHVHGPISLVFHTERAVPLDHFFYLDGQLHLVQDADGNRVARFPGIGGEAKLARQRNRARRWESVSPEIAAGEASARARRSVGAGADASGATSGAAQADEPEEPKERQAPEPGEVLTSLRAAGLLPCIYFLPGRRAVEVAAESAKGHLLVSPEERARLQAEVQEWVARLPADDRKLDQVQRLAALIPRGLAYHHAGLLPALKVMVETLFQRGDLRAVFATDTLALGINMPARSVVLGSLSKFDGQQMRLMTPNEYQQLTGRAGRRGIDVKGAAVLLYSPWDPFEPSFAQLTAPLLPVTSAFAVRYNTVLNLWRPGDVARLRTAVGASLREFQRRGGAYESRAQRSAQQQIEVEAEAPRRESHQRRKQRERRSFLLSKAAVAELEGTIAVLRALRYVGPDDALTVKGRLLRALFHPAGMVLVELLVGGVIEGLNAAELAEVLSWFTFDDDRPLRNLNYLTGRMQQIRREIFGAHRRVAEIEYEEGLPISPGIMESFHGVALNWHRGFSLGGLLRRIDLAEGDLLVVLNQTIDLVQQVQAAVGQTLDAKDLWTRATDESRYGRFLIDVRGRLVRMRPILDQAWRAMLRGSVAQSRAIPAMITPAPAGAPDLPMAEDEDTEDVRLDRDEEPPDVLNEARGEV